MQGAVYHWTVSTGFSLAEATNLYVGQPGRVMSHLQEWYPLLCTACTQVTILPQTCLPFCLYPVYHSTSTLSTILPLVPPIIISWEDSCIIYRFDLLGALLWIRKEKRYVGTKE